MDERKEEREEMKLIPISREYRKNYDRIFRFRNPCPKCLGKKIIVYGPETKGGKKEVKCKECR